MLCSNGIEMVTEKEQRELSTKDTALCTSCQMLVVWIQNQLKQKKTKEIVFNYVNQVGLLNHPVQKPKLWVTFISVYSVLIFIYFFT